MEEEELYLMMENYTLENLKTTNEMFLAKTLPDTMRARKSAVVFMVAFGWDY